MDKKEARELLDKKIAEVRVIPYDQLRKRIAPARWSFFGGWLEIGGGGEPHTDEVIGLSGTLYQTEVQVFDDGGRSAFRPMSDDFIMASDGSFVDE